MGATIHFKGTIKSPARIQPLIYHVQSITEELGWKYRILDYDFSKPQALKGIVLSLTRKANHYSYSLTRTET